MNEVDVTWRGKFVRLHYIDTNDHQYRYTSTTGRFYEFAYLSYIHYVGRTAGFRTAYDIGTCFANHSAFFGALMGCKVYCFEPNAALHGIIRNTLEGNGVEYQLLGAALSSTSSSGSLDKQQSNIGSSHVVMPKEGDETFPIRTLDDIISEEKLEIPDFLKIDTEGFELNVFKGGVNLLKDHGPDIFVEIDKANKEQVYQFLQGLDYEFITRIGKNYHFSKKYSPLRKVIFRLKAIGCKTERELFKVWRRIKSDTSQYQSNPEVFTKQRNK